MLVTTTETVPGKETMEVLGQGRNTVRARNVGQDITQGLRNVTGGELEAYSTLMTKAREEAQDCMEAEAEELSADAVVNLGFAASQVAGNAAEVLAYGTAVRAR